MNKLIIGIIIVALLFSAHNVVGGPFDRLMPAVFSNNPISFTLDCSDLDGEIRSFSGINCGPYPNHDIPEGVDLSNQYQ